MAVSALRHLSLCAGYGGLNLGLSLALRDAVRTVGYVEREAAAAATLVARMEDEALDSAPVWDDLETFDGRAWRGAVDIVSAGFPCQPWSIAGKRAGTEDARWLWPAVLRVAVDMGAGLVFLENVPGLVTGHGLEYVLSDLAAHGFDAEWLCISAGACGASHRRERVFILAYQPERGCGVLRRAPWGDGQPACGDAGVADTGLQPGSPEQFDKPRGPLGWEATQTDALRARECGEAMADAEGAGHEAHRNESGRGPTRWPMSCQQGGNMADAQDADWRAGGSGVEGRAGRRRGGLADEGTTVAHPTSDIRRAPRHVGSIALDRTGSVGDATRQRGESAEQPGRWPGAFPPGPGEYEAWAAVLAEHPDLAPAIPQPAIRGMADGAPGRVDRLRMLGNGVVPLQAAYAFCTLAARVQERLGHGG